MYRVITMETESEELERFFEMGNEFAVVTDGGRRWVLELATRGGWRSLLGDREGYIYWAGAGGLRLVERFMDFFGILRERKSQISIAAAILSVSRDVLLTSFPIC